MKKLFFIALLALVNAPHAFAEGFTPLAGIPGLTADKGQTTSIVQSQSLATFFNNLYLYLIGFAAIAAIIMIIWGGFEYATQDSISAKGAGKERIKEALFGLVLVLSPVLVFSIINPSILNLSLNLTPLNQAPSGPGSGVTVGNASGGVAGLPWCYTTKDSSGTVSSPCYSDKTACDDSQQLASDPVTSSCSQKQSLTANNNGCTASGAAGILQIAICPSHDAAQTWAQSCGGSPSPITDLTKSTDGNVTSARVLCAGTQTYLFIDVHPSTLGGNAINRLSALTTGGGASAMQFASICSSLGWKTCISRNPAVSFATACPSGLPNIPANVPGKCYSENITCEDSFSASASGNCTIGPTWTLFQ